MRVARRDPSWTIHAGMLSTITSWLSSISRATTKNRHRTDWCGKVNARKKFAKSMRDADDRTDDHIRRMMARTIVLLGPELAVVAGIDPRVQRIPRERLWLAGLGLGTGALTPLVGAGTAQVLLALALSITITRLLVHRVLIQKVSPKRTVDANELARWRQHVRSLTFPPHPHLLKRAEANVAHQGCVRIPELVEACSQIAITELRPRP